MTKARIVRDDERVAQHRERADRLLAQLVDAAAVEQPVHAGRDAVVAKKPTSRVPTRPPTRWTPTTSSESSKPKRNFRPTASAHRTPAMTPTAIAPSGETDEQAGVIATRPATAPDAAPRRGRLAVPDLLDEQPADHRGRGGDHRVDERDGGEIAGGQRGAGVEPEPAEPQQARRRASPTARLCGRIGSRGHPRRLPMTIASASAAAPALMCTAVPPAKSMRPELRVGDPAADRVGGDEPVEREHPVGDREVHDRRPEAGEDQPACRTACGRRPRRRSGRR